MCFLASLIFSCASTPERVSIKPLYRGIEEYPAMDSSAKQHFLSENHLLLNTFTEFLGLGVATPDVVGRWASGAAVKVFTPAVDSVFPSLEPLERSLGGMEANFEKYGLDIPSRTYAAVVWGNPKSVVLSDSCVLIALNHFLGADYPGYRGLYEYLLPEKEPVRLPYSLCTALIATAYPFESAEPSTVLAKMVYQGALAYAVEHCVPGASDRATLGYSRQQWDWLRDNASEIWKLLAARNMIHTSDEAVSSRLLDPSPATSVISPDCPPRAGAFIGYLIVRHHMENSSAGISDILSPDFYNSPTVLIDTRFTL